MNKLIAITGAAIAINIMTGMLITLFPIFTELPALRGGLNYDSGVLNPFVEGMEQNVSPSGVLEDEGNAIYRVLDTLNLGFIQRFLNVVPFYTHGLIVILDNMIGRYLGQDMYNLLFSKPFGILYSVMTFMYILFAWSWWTGKSVEDS